MLLTSRRNPLVAQFRRARDGGDPMRFLVEGVRFLEEAEKLDAPLEVVLATERVASSDRGAPLLERLRARGVVVRLASEEVLDAACAAKVASGAAALARRRECQVSDLFPSGEPPFVVAALGLADPGNLGTLIRTADAAGATGFATARDTVSPWNDKALRATAGSIFRLPIAAGAELADLVANAKKTKTKIAATAARGGEDFDAADLRPPILLLLGSEAFGLQDDALRAADLRVRIPLRSGVESLNVAAAGAILCFAAARGARR